MMGVVMRKSEKNDLEVMIVGGGVLRRFHFTARRIELAKHMASALAILVAASFVTLAYQFGNNSRLQDGIELRNRQIKAQQEVIESLNMEHQRLKTDVWTLGRMLASAQEKAAVGKESGLQHGDSLIQSGLDSHKLEDLSRRYDELAYEIKRFERHLHGQDTHVNETPHRIDRIDRLRRAIALLEELGTHDAATLVSSLRDEEESLVREEEKHHMLLFGEDAQVSCRLPRSEQFRMAVESYIRLAEQLAQTAIDVESITADIVAATGSLDEKSSPWADVAKAARKHISASRDFTEGLRKVLAVPTGAPLVNFLPTSLYGLRKDPFTGALRKHRGIDYAAPVGSEVTAPSYGTVAFAGRRGGYGKVVDIDHGNGLITRYAHLSRIASAEGDPVNPGDVIGHVGSTGRSTGSHLHYEVILNGKQVDPLPFIEAADVNFECKSYFALTGGKSDEDV